MNTDLCPHGKSPPCWRCEGLDQCDWLRAMRALTTWPRCDGSRQCVDHYDLPPGCVLMRTQEIPNSAGPGDTFRTKRGKTWTLCARGPNWAIVAKEGQYGQ